MKRVIVAIVVIVSLACITGSSFAQISVPVSKTVTVNPYVGILSWSAFSVDSLHASHEAGIRFGAIAVWRPTNWFAVKGTAVYNLATGNNSWSMNQMSAIFNPVKSVTITVGNMATLVTEQRPSPATADGQFETFTEAQIPGMALCAKAVWDVTENVSFGGAVASRNDKPEYQAMFRWKDIKLSGLYSEWDKKVGGALTVKVWKITEVFVYRQDKVVSNLFMLNLGPDKNWCLYSDTGYDLQQDKLVRGEWGALYNFSSKYVKGLIGPGYCHDDRSIHVYLFVHL